MENYRVRMAITNEDGEELAMTDEPLYSNEDEISVQAYRTLRQLKGKRVLQPETE